MFLKKIILPLALGKRLFKSAAALTFLVGAIGCPWAIAAPDAITAGGAQQDVRVLKRALVELHPALTKYRKQVEIDAALSRFEARGAASRTATDMYLAATELAAAIRCGHTWTNVLNQTVALKSALLDAANKLPLHITLVEGRWLVLASTDPGISAGDEILAVDGISATEMVARLMPYLRADGSSDGKRLRQLGHDRFDYSQLDILWPLLSSPVGGQYRLDVRRRDGVRVSAAVKATSMASRERELADHGTVPMSKDWAFRIEGDIAILTMPSFSFWNSSFDWEKYIDGAIERTVSGAIPNLVIDIRENEGGRGDIGPKILSHFLVTRLKYISNQSITAYERVPYVLARYLDTWDFGFFDRTGQVEKITSGSTAGKYLFKPNAAIQQIIEPAAPHFKGHVFLLVGAENSSATFEFAKRAKQLGTVTLVGQATGGNLRGLNGGELAWVTLPNSGVAVDIPLLAAYYGDDPPDAALMPDILVERTFSARAAGRDLEMEAVKRQIRGP